MYWLFLFITITCVFLLTRKKKKAVSEVKNNTVEVLNNRKEQYKEYLQSEHWKETRTKALKRAGYKCQVCGYKSNLQVHHNNYSNLGHEDDTDLVVLCWKCHKTFHHK